MVSKLKNLELLQNKGNSIRIFKTTEEIKYQESTEKEVDEFSDKSIELIINYQKLKKLKKTISPKTEGEEGEELTTEEVTKITELALNYTEGEEVTKITELARNYQKIKNTIINYKPNTSKLKKIDVSIIRDSKKEIVQNALKIVCENINAQTAAIFLISKRGILERFGIYGFDKNGEPVDDTWFTEETYKVAESFTGKAVKSQKDSEYGEIQYTSNLSDEDLKPEYKEKYLDKFGSLNSGIAIPLNGANRTYGVLRVINKSDKKVEPGTKPYLSENSFSDKDVYLLLFLATNIANALSNFRRDVQVEILNYLSHLLIQPSQTTEESLKKIYKQAIDLLIKNPEMGFKAGILRVKDDTSDTLKIQATSLEAGVSDNRDNSNRKRNDDEFFWIAFNKQKCLIVRDLQALIHQEKNQPIPIFKNQDWIVANGFQSTGCFPLVAKGKTVGTFSLYTGSKYLFSPETIKFVEGVADLLASFILNMKLEKEKHELQKSLALKSQTETEAKFKKLAEKWKSETRFLSSVTEMLINPTYLQIIGLGPDVIPLLLRELAQNDEPDHWFWALSAITGENPIAPEQRGKMNEIKEAWIKWGKSKGYVN